HDAVGHRFYPIAGDRIDTIVPEIRIADPCSSIAQHQTGHEIGPVEIDLLSNLPADRKPTNNSFGDPQRSQKAHKIVGMICDPVGRASDARKPVTALIVEQNTKIAVESGDDV